MSMSSIPNKFVTLATQKKKPLIINELILYFYISTNANDTNELNPALSIIIIRMRNFRFWKMGRKRETWIIMAAVKPITLRKSIILRFWNLEWFLMNEPRLLKMAEDRLAANPIRAISLLVKFCPENIMPNNDP